MAFKQSPQKKKKKKKRDSQQAQLNRSSSFPTMHSIDAFKVTNCKGTKRCRQRDSFQCANKVAVVSHNEVPTVSSIVGSTYLLEVAEGDPTMRAASILYSSGKYQSELGDFEKALQYFEVATARLAMGGGMAPCLLSTLILHEAGTCYYNLGHNEYALRCFLLAMEDAQTANLHPRIQRDISVSTMKVAAAQDC